MTSPLHTLLSAAAVRERAHEMLELALAGEVEGWRVDLSRLDEVADRTAAVTRERFPSLDIPFHARGRHFVAGAPKLPGGGAERARAAFDLNILSVLLDAGSGPNWRYREAGETYTRSEGLAVASQRMFESGAFALSSLSAEPMGRGTARSAVEGPADSGKPLHQAAPGPPPHALRAQGGLEGRLLRADGAALAQLAPETLAHGFQVDEANPLLGLDGRAALLRRLGAQVMARPDLFATADAPRPGGLYDVLAARTDGGTLPAAAILELLLEALGPIWADRLVVDGVALGDCWRHPALKRGDATDGLVPLHKLSQWLAYSLIEPLQEAGVAVVEIDGLTGLAEYRNGGLFVDAGVLVLTDPADWTRTHHVSDPLIVAWRSLTVALLDRLAPLVRERLGVSQAAFPLARMLEGGTWQAGRRIAAERRAGGGPPFNILSDGTVF